MGKHVVARLSGFAPGGRKLVVTGHEIALFNAAGEYFALLNRCQHEGASLCAGRQTGRAEADTPGDIQISRRGEVVKCPWHGRGYNLRTGLSVCAPGGPKPCRYKISGEQAAEPFAMSVEADYVLIEGEGWYSADVSAARICLGSPPRQQSALAGRRLSMRRPDLNLPLP